MKGAAKEKALAREALETLSKDELVTRAEALGIDGARKFTKLELVDEIARVGGGDDRGLLGKARDLLRDVVERGIARTVAAPKTNGDHANVTHGDAGALSSSDSSNTSSPSTRPSAVERVTVPEAPVPTVTLAEIYAAQGHVKRAQATLREVLGQHPDDAAAKALLQKLSPTGETATPLTREPRESRASDGVLPDDPWARVSVKPEAFVEPEPARYRDVPAMLDDAPFPERYDVDECVALAVDPTTIYVYWEARPQTVERARRAMARDVAADGSEPALSTLRVLIVEPAERAPRVSTRDFDLIDLEFGEWFVRDLPAGSIVRAAIGLRAGERFLPVAHTVDVEAPPASPSRAIAQNVVVWSEDATRAHAPSPGAAPTRTRTPEPPIARELGMLGLPPVPLAPGEGEDDEAEIPEGRGLSSADLARRRRVARARDAIRAQQEGAPGGGAAGAPGSSDLLAGPTSAGFSRR